MPDEQFIHDEHYVESFANIDHKVFGRRLDPYCLWHQFNLEVIQSPVLLGGPLTPLDLLAAVRICTTPWTDRFRVPNLKPPGLLGFFWEAGRFKFKGEVARFQAYLDDYVSAPKFWPNQHEKQNAAPDRDLDEHLETAIYLIRETTMTWEQVWTAPVGILKWIQTGNAKLTGVKAPIWTPEHEVLFEEHKLRRESRIRKRAEEVATRDNLPVTEALEKVTAEYWEHWNNEQQPPDWSKPAKR